MGCRIIVGHEAGSDHEIALLYCSTSGWAFGPVIGVDELGELRGQDAHDIAQAFCNFIPGDPRSYRDAEIARFWDQFCGKRKEALAALRAANSTAAT